MSDLVKRLNDYWPDDGDFGPTKLCREAAAEIFALAGRNKRLEDECFTLAAGQCCVKSGGLMADDHGRQYCDMERQRDELRGKLRVMANIMGDALRVMKTIEEGESDDESALDSLRAKMAGAIDSVRRAEMAADKASAQSSPVEAPSAS